MFKNKTLVTIFFTIFIDLIGIGILIPVIPQLFANPDSPEFMLRVGTSLNKGYVLLGFLIALYPIGQFFATPILGQLSDRYGRKKILALSLLGTSISYVLFAYAIITKNIPLLFASRFFDGLTGGNISVAQAMISDVSLPENRARNFGMLGAAFGLGFIFGPYIGGKLSDPSVVSWFTTATPFYFAAILAFINMLSVWFLLRETNMHPRSDKITWNKSISNIIHAAKMPGVNVIFITNFIFFAGFTFFTTFFGVYLINRFGFTQGRIGDFFAYVGIWSAFTQAVMVKLFVKFPQKKIIQIAIVASGLLILAYFLPKHPWGLYLIPPFFSLCTGLIMANLTSLLSRLAPMNMQGEMLGINASVQALAQSIPAILSGFIAASLTAETPIIVSSILVIFAGLTFAKLYKAPESSTI
jgi:DHA1 family tetracycline resistance protein-like MFS transporter